MKNPHLFARCLEPVAMTEEWLRVCIAIVTGDEFFAEDRERALKAAGAFPFGEPRAPMSIEGGLATISVDGPLVRKAGGVSDVSGLTSYDAIRKDLRSALADPKVREVALAIDSPGGEMSGLFELADEIHAARDRKPMRADVVRADSAGYVLAAAAGNISIEQMGEAGSVGVVAGARRPGANGSDVIEFVSSVSPLKRPDVTTDEGRAEYQKRVDYAGEKLAEKVAAYRGVSVETVKQNYGRGAVLLGEQARAAGLVDRVGSARAPSAQRTPSHMGAHAMTTTSDQLQHLGSETMRLLGAATPDEAQGALVAAAQALTDVGPLRLQLAAAQATANRYELRSTLQQGLAATRLSLGDLKATVPHFIVDDARRAQMDAAIGALAEKEGARKEGDPSAWTAENLIAAVSSVDVTAGEVQRIAGWSARKAPSQQPIHREPPPDPKREQAADVEVDETAARITEAGKRARAHYDKPAPAAAK